MFLSKARIRKNIFTIKLNNLSNCMLRTVYAFIFSITIFDINF